MFSIVFGWVMIPAIRKLMKAQRMAKPIPPPYYQGQRWHG